MLLVFVFYLCLLERCQHTYNRGPKKKKSDTEMCRHTAIYMYVHTYRHQHSIVLL